MSFILFLHSMKPKQFSIIFEHALNMAASVHNQHYAEGGAAAWGLTGASYLGFALCGFPQSELRRVQYHTRDNYGSVILDCKWYDMLKSECLNGQKALETLLPGPEETLCECSVTEDLFLEMLDFCREG